MGPAGILSEDAGRISVFEGSELTLPQSSFIIRESENNAQYPEADR